MAKNENGIEEVADFTPAGTPDLGALSNIVEFEVTPEEGAIAWRLYQER